MKYLMLILVVISATILAANSIFSFEGMPIQYYGNDVYGTGVGGSGSGDLFRINTNYFNPSLPVTSNKVTFSTAVSMGYVHYEDDDSGYTDDGIFFPYFTITVPVSAHKFAFSFNSFASGDLDTQKSAVMDEIEYEEIKKISSSLYKMDLIYAFKNKILNIGASVNYYIGHRTRYWNLDFDDTDIIDTKYELEKNFKSAGFSVGVSRKLGNFSWGAAYSSQVDLEGDIIYKYTHPPYADTLSLNEDIGMNVPARYSSGLTWRFKENLKASVDVYYDQWEDTDEYDKNTMKIAAGISYDPLSGYGKWYERIPLRMGGSYRELPFDTEGESVFEKALSCGFSIPLKSASKKIDISLQYLTRGDLDSNGLKDSSYFLSIGVTGFDIFSKRIKRTGHRDIPKPD